MTPNAIAFYAVAVLIVLAAGAAVGLPSLRHAGYAGGAVIVLMAVLELISGAYALAVVQLVVPAVAAVVVTLVLRRDAYRGLLAVPAGPERFWIAAPIAVGIAAVLIVDAGRRRIGLVPGLLGLRAAPHPERGADHGAPLPRTLRTGDQCGRRDRHRGRGVGHRTPEHRRADARPVPPAAPAARRAGAQAP